MITAKIDTIIIDIHEVIWELSYEYTQKDIMDSLKSLLDYEVGQMGYPLSSAMYMSISRLGNHIDIPIKSVVARNCGNVAEEIYEHLSQCYKQNAHLDSKLTKTHYILHIV